MYKSITQIVQDMYDRGDNPIVLSQQVFQSYIDNTVNNSKYRDENGIEYTSEEYKEVFGKPLTFDMVMFKDRLVKWTRTPPSTTNNVR